ncbi:MAG: 16S rRNA (guanine(527)-N(7))-methyltransferase RsmG [Gammaproteobacteria bacterium]|nr:16S rRNA (guanine(527)-N(7))-methyltransferase RsmG [Gammaproteobacteria bacterium]
MKLLTETLSKGITELGLELSEAQQIQLLDYLDLLLKWNRVYNLTAINSHQSGVVRHLLDSLAIAPYIDGERLLDVGSGGGLPGIPLAIAYPEKQFVLLDSNSKKTRFLVQAKGELGLDNLNVVHSRIEEFRAERPFNTSLSRAFASLKDIVTLTGHLLDEGGALMAMKGQIDLAELADIPQDYRVEKKIELAVPGLQQEQRHLLIIRHVRHDNTDIY